LLVEGKTSYVYFLPDGGRVRGQDLLSRDDWPWHDSAQLPGVRSARLTATSPSYGRVTVVIVDQPGRDRYYLLCLETTMAAPQLIRAWRRRSWLEHSFRTLKHLLATEACQVPTEGAYFGHLVLRLLAGLVLMYTARVLFKGRVTMEEIRFSLKHYWRWVHYVILTSRHLGDSTVVRWHETMVGQPTCGGVPDDHGRCDLL
jgi:hypothetical protein